jgi:hypothetical protein
VLTSPNNPYDFGSNLSVGSINMAMITLSEPANQTDTIMSVMPDPQHCGQFTVDAGSAVPLGTACGSTGSNPATGIGLVTGGGGPCPHDFNFVVTFHPTQPGSQSCNIDVLYGGAMASTIYTVTATGTAVGSAYSLQVAPNVDFGSVQDGTTSQPQTVKIVNNGTGVLTITPTLINSSGVYADSGSDFSHPLPPGSSESHNITCSPPSGAPSGSAYPGSLMVTSIDQGGSAGPSGNATLNCQSLSTMLTVNPAPISFGTTYVGKPPANIPVTVTAPLGTAWTASSVTLDGSAMSNGVTVGMVNQFQPTGSGSASATFAVQWPASMSATGALGTATLTTTSGTRTVNINGTAAPGSIATNPPSIDFGPVCANGSASQMLEVYASDVADVQLKAAAATGAGFSVDASQLVPNGKTLLGNHNGSVMLPVKLAGSAATGTGPITGKINLTTDLPTPLDHVDLTATIMTAGVQPSPMDGLQFGTVAVNMFSSPKVVTLSNCSGNTLMIDSTKVVGSGSDSFANITSGVTMIGNGSSQQFMILMAPKTPGPKHAQLEIDPAGSAAILVDLYGNAGGSASSGERQTYYACSTGRAVALWPIALALAWLARRRRRR